MNTPKHNKTTAVISSLSLVELLLGVMLVCLWFATPVWKMATDMHLAKVYAVQGKGMSSLLHDLKLPQCGTKTLQTTQPNSFLPLYLGFGFLIAASVLYIAATILAGQKRKSFVTTALLVLLVLTGYLGKKALYHPVFKISEITLADYIAYGRQARAKFLCDTYRFFAKK